MLSYCFSYIIGQFQKSAVKLDQTFTEALSNEKPARLLFWSPLLESQRAVVVWPLTRMNLLRKEHVPCWHIRHPGRGFLLGKPNDYLVPKLTHSRLPDGILAKHGSMKSRIDLVLTRQSHLKSRARLSVMKLRHRELTNKD